MGETERGRWARQRWARLSGARQRWATHEDPKFGIDGDDAPRVPRAVAFEVSFHDVAHPYG